MNNKINTLFKFKFLLKKPTVVVIIGEEREESKQRIEQILSAYFKIKREVLVFTADNKNINSFNFFLKYSKQPIFAVTQMNSLQKNIIETINFLPNKTTLIFNFDNLIAKKIKKMTNVKALSFGLSPESDFTAINDASLKINHKGSIIPTWLKEKSQKDTYAILCSLVIGSVLGLNLVEISQIFKKNNISL